MQEFSLYERLGEENLHKLVDKFYDLVFDDPVIKDLFKSDKEEIKRKQFMFLSQFLGGPPLYSEVHGHPRLRARHLPHVITEEKATAWLKCMHAAIGSLDIAEEMKNELFDRFPKTAFFMVNSD
jgi:hemoglobin